ncbi:NAD(P)H-binding protein [Mucilaginibacter terrae]|uniref:Nucleoside-diphosphate-sugar epimerase n=1 Tax=Mucilaginibacter terrae TaxID=1955052 RepID=A0ABU3GZ84_9SPHI|nr:NAD(P)H-binding protein [Mucilaginibacter terrae]MDT3403985.1 nucleoside-diphosphate-sugar epimerase [Mucilaginibacter terrae]
MKVFVTGASGFVGLAVVNELLQHGHEVLGLVRSDKGAEQLRAAGAEVLLGDVNNPDHLRKGVLACDAVIHTAFNHDFSQYKANCEADRLVIQTLGDALVNTQKTLVIKRA